VAGRAAALFREPESRDCADDPANAEEEQIREVKALYLDLIAAAKHSIYAENQYFASGAIAAIAARLLKQDGSEFVLVMPATADGWLEEEVMGSARVRLMQAIGKVDHHRRFRIYTRVTAGGEPIYVHSKVMIVDRDVLRVGSSNWNNRSLGLDSEYDVVVERPSNAEIVDQNIILVGVCASPSCLTAPKLVLSRFRSSSSAPAGAS
jgi:phospholipase D1/2